MAAIDGPGGSCGGDHLRRDRTQFELVAAVKDWNAAKRVTVLPTLFRGKLFNIYIELSEHHAGVI